MIMIISRITTTIFITIFIKLSSISIVISIGWIFMYDSDLYTKANKDYNILRNFCDVGNHTSSSILVSILVAMGELDTTTVGTIV